MAISSPLKSKISKSSTTTVKKFQTILFNRTRVKKEIFQNKTILQNRRVENERRVQAEEELEAPDIAVKRGGPAQLIAGSAKGFFERILGFLGYVTAGWIINNLPTWISMGKEFIARTQQMGKILGNFIGNTTKILQNFTGLLSASLTNIIKFDFLDTSGRVGAAFEELQLSVDNWGTGFEDAIKLITTPLTEGIASGEDARPTGTQNTDEGAYERTAPYSGSGDVSGYGTKEQQALLKTIRFAEGTGGSTGYSMFFGDKPEKSKYGDLTKLSANEVEKLVNKFLNDPQSRYGGGKSAAVGAFQIIDITAKSRALGMDMNRKFDQSFQDEMALRLAASRGVTSEVLKKEGLSETVIKKLSPEWASFPGNTYGQPTKRSQDLKSVYQSSLSSPTSQAPSSQISQTPSGKGGKIVEYLTGDRTHKRYRADHAAGNYHDHVAFDSQKTRDAAMAFLRGRGWTIGSINTGRHADGSYHYSNQAFDIPFYPNQSKKGVTDDAKGETKLSSRFRADLIAGGFSGPQLGGSSTSSPTTTKSTTQSSPTTTKSTKQPAQTQSPPPTQAQITPTVTQQNTQVNQSLTPERRGQTVIIAQNPSQPQQQTMPYGGGGSSGGGSSSQTNEFSLLNIFMKNKLLLDLAYL